MRMSHHVTSCLRPGTIKELVFAASQAIVTGVEVWRANAGGLCKRRSDPHGFGCLKGATASTLAGKACSKACSSDLLHQCLVPTAAMMLLQVPITAGAPIPAAGPVEPESLSKEAWVPFITSGKLPKLRKHQHVCGGGKSTWFIFSQKGWTDLLWTKTMRGFA